MWYNWYTYLSVCMGLDSGILWPCVGDTGGIEMIIFILCSLLYSLVGYFVTAWLVEEWKEDIVGLALIAAIICWPVSLAWYFEDNIDNFLIMKYTREEDEQ